MQSANLSGPLKGLRPYQALIGPTQASGLAGGFDLALYNMHCCESSSRRQTEYWHVSGKKPRRQVSGIAGTEKTKKPWTETRCRTLLWAAAEALHTGNRLFCHHYSEWGVPNRAVAGISSGENFTES